jgi:hypothetical protein
MLSPHWAPLLLRQKTAQERLGHASIAMPLDLFSHTTADMQRHAGDALELLAELTPVA